MSLKIFKRYKSAKKATKPGNLVVDIGYGFHVADVMPGSPIVSNDPHAKNVSRCDVAIGCARSFDDSLAKRLRDVAPMMSEPCAHCNVEAGKPCKAVFAGNITICLRRKRASLLREVAKLDGQIDQLNKAKEAS